MWEHSCIKNIEKGDFSRAIGNLNVMNWQCQNKEGIHITSENVVKGKNALNQAIAAKEEYLKKNKRWICFPELSVGRKKQYDFYKNIGMQIYKILRTRGINEDVSYVIIGQVALETAWGTKVVENNLFNIKGQYNNKSTSFVTHEQLSNGEWTKITDSFRSYPGIELSISDYLNILKEKWNRSYLTAVSTNGDVDLFIDGLHSGDIGGYATDKSYSKKLKLLYTIMRDLFQTNLIPTYLSCIGRQDELNQIREELNEKK